MPAVQTEGAVGAPGRTENLVGWLLFALDEVPSLVFKGAASIHVNQE